jgi:hypothetical protein
MVAGGEFRKRLKPLEGLETHLSVTPRSTIGKENSA